MVEKRKERIGNAIEIAKSTNYSVLDGKGSNIKIKQCQRVC